MAGSTKILPKIRSMSELTNKIIGDFAVKMWGKVLYVDYGLLPSGPGDLDRLKFYISKYLQMDEDRLGVYDKEDEEDWFYEGASIRGEKLMTKKVYDQMLRYKEVKVKSPFGMKVYRSGEVRTGWNSFIALNEKAGKGYGSAAQPTFEYKLPRGAKYIATDGYADDDEVIIDGSQVPKAYRTLTYP
jgi:hypothetical protein